MTQQMKEFMESLKKAQSGVRSLATDIYGLNNTHEIDIPAAHVETVRYLITSASISLDAVRHILQNMPAK